MRVVGGRFRGRGLTAPKGLATRPTSDKVREALFNILSHGLGFEIDGARVLDLFAGTGALGLEALSRGATYALFVEDSAEARGAIRENVEALGLTGATKIWRRDATRLGPCAPMPPFGLVFADPPYGKGLGERALMAALDGGWLAPGALCVLEESADVALTLPETCAARVEPVDSRTYGDTTVHFLRHAAEPQPR
jgi:16S rRNA (guanine966-N2)-methyltransferase